MRSYSVDAIVLAKKKFGEADSLVTIFTKQKGKITVLAKGVRKPTSRKKGALDTFCHARLQIAKTKALDLITEAQIINNFSVWRKDLKRVTLAYYMAEIVDQLTREGEEHPEVFGYLLSAYSYLSEFNNLRAKKDDFSIKLLVSLGFWRESLNLSDTQELLESIIERKLSTPRVGKKLLS